MSTAEQVKQGLILWEFHRGGRTKHAWVFDGPRQVPLCGKPIRPTAVGATWMRQGPRCAECEQKISETR